MMKNTIDQITLTALLLLAISLLTSITLMAGFHILIIPPVLYYMAKYDWKRFPLSAWALLLFSLVVIISVIFNQDIISSGYKNISKTKYFFIGALSIIPLQFYFKELMQSENRDKIIKVLLRGFLIAATLATVSGLIAFETGYNILKMKYVQTSRNSGMFGMLITYAHSVALLCTILVSMLIHRNKIKQWVPDWLILTSLIISLAGLISSYTRGALLAFLFSLIFINKKIAGFAMTVIVILGITISIIKPNFINDHILRLESNNERIGCWLAAVEAFKERPVLGYGYQNLEPLSSSIKVKYNIRNSYFGGNAHNNFLEILATTGLIGIIFFLAWIVLWGKDLIKNNDLVSRILFPAWICFLVGGLTQVTFNDGENTFFIMILFALTYVTNLNESFYKISKKV